MNSSIECKWCGQKFVKKGLLGRHYDYWVYSRSPRPPDQRHTEEAIEEMRMIRDQAKRKPRAGTPVGESSPDHKRTVRSLQNKASYARHMEKNRERGRGKHDYLVARTMALREIEKEIALKERISHRFDISPSDGPDLVNFATIVYLFLPHHTSLLPDLVDQGLSSRATDSGWKVAIPGRREYMALCLMLHPDRNPGAERAWMQTLVSEWEKWDGLEDGEKSVKAMQELGRAFIRQKHRADALQGYSLTTLQEKVEKWESRIQGDRQSGNNITRDRLDTLLAQDMHESFPDLLEESGDDIDDDIDIDDIFRAGG